MKKEQIENKIKELTEMSQKLQQSIAEQQKQFIACQGALQVLHELLNAEEKENTADETVKD